MRIRNAQVLNIAQRKKQVRNGQNTDERGQERIDAAHCPRPLLLRRTGDGKQPHADRNSDDAEGIHILQPLNRRVRLEIPSEQNDDVNGHGRQQ